MRVAIDIRPLQTAAKDTFVGTYVRKLTAQFQHQKRSTVLLAWPDVPIAMDPAVLNRSTLVEIPRPVNMFVLRYLGYRYDGSQALDFYRELARQVDLIHFTGPCELFFGWPWADIGVAKVLTVFDLMPITHPDLALDGEMFPKTAFLKMLHQRQIQRFSTVDGIIAVSQYTESVLRSHLKQCPTLQPIWCGISDDYVLPYITQIEQYRNERDLPPKFILFSGTSSRNNNLNAILQALSPKSPWPLVVAGHFSEEDKNQINRHYSGLDIVWLGDVDRQEMSMLYASAGMFVYPSLIEGFAMPVLEAMAVGTPVACSNTSSMPEIVGSAALTFNPAVISEIQGAIYKIISDEYLRKQMRTRGLERAQHLSWRRTADTTWMAYESFSELYKSRKMQQVL